MTDQPNISNLVNDSGKGVPLISKKEEALARKYPLAGKTIGISISESDNLSELGYGIVHLKDAMIEIARYIVASGGTLVYGGDMRQGGFTELIFDLLAYYKADKSAPPNERFYSYLAYPISTTLSIEKEAELRQNVSFRRIAPPTDLAIANQNEFLKPDSPQNLYVWTRCLTKMREDMEASCNARVFMGGKTSGFKGKYPGILEEFTIALEQKHPIYLVGTFGGMTKHIIDVLNGQIPICFTEHYYTDNADYVAMKAIFDQHHPDARIIYSDLLDGIQRIGLKGIARQNGLSEADNFRLATTPHISEIVYLILKGLTNQFTK